MARGPFQACRDHDLIQISKFSASSVLFGTGLVPVTCQLQEAAKLLKNPGLEFWICCRDFCSDLINGDISPLKREVDYYGICQAFKNEL